MSKLHPVQITDTKKGGKVSTGWYISQDEPPFHGTVRFKTREECVEAIEAIEAQQVEDEPQDFFGDDEPLTNQLAQMEQEVEDEEPEVLEGVIDEGDPDIIEPSPEDIKATADAIAAIDTANKKANTDTEKIWQIPLVDIRKSPYNSRNMDAVDVSGLVESIKEHGVVEPVLVRQVDGYDGYELISGHCRVKACLMAGLDHIPARIMVVDDDKARSINIIENLHRKDLTPWESYRSIRALLDDDYEVDEIAAAIGTSHHAYRPGQCRGRDDCEGPDRQAPAVDEG